MAEAGLLRQENTALLRRAMQDGVFSKNELARQTGLSFPTVGRIIDDMVERGEAREAGVAASTGGRCAMRYELDMHYRLFLCLRLEQDTLHWFVCGLDGVPLEQGEETCPGDVRELLDTLECWFVCFGNQRQMAQLMHLHYNTVAYRLHQLWGILPGGQPEGDARLALQTALYLYRRRPDICKRS